MSDHIEQTRRRLCERSFAAFGLSWLGYVKFVRQGEYNVYGADGTHLGQFGDRATADAALRQHDMESHSVH